MGLAQLFFGFPRVFFAFRAKTKKALLGFLVVWAHPLEKPKKNKVFVFVI